MIARDSGLNCFSLVSISQMCRNTPKLDRKLGLITDSKLQYIACCSRISLNRACELSRLMSNLTRICDRPLIHPFISSAKLTKPNKFHDQIFIWNFSITIILNLVYSAFLGDQQNGILVTACKPTPPPPKKKISKNCVESVSLASSVKTTNSISS